MYAVALLDELPPPEVDAGTSGLRVRPRADGPSNGNHDFVAQADPRPRSVCGVQRCVRRRHLNRHQACHQNRHQRPTEGSDGFEETRPLEPSKGGGRG